LIFSFTSSVQAELTDNGDGTVTDTDTGLMWLKESLPVYLGPGEPYDLKTWIQAMLWADSLDFAGYSDWRLPSALKIINTGVPDLQWHSVNNEWGHLYGIEWSDPESETDIAPMVGYPCCFYWTSTEDPSNSSYAAEFFISYDNLWLNQFQQKSSQLRYTAVRGAPIPTLVGEIDVIQVLDRSGSMGGSASLTMPDTKIQVLRTAASQIIDIMKADIGNRLGLVQFNQDVVSFPAGSSDALSELTSTRAVTLKTVAIPSIVHGGRTSIGDGLREALTQFTTPPLFPDHDRSIILVTDGRENMLENISTVQPDLISNSVTVYPLGLGYGSGINETKLTDLAAATAGTYRISADHLVFQKLFIEALAGAVDWSVITDPIDEITNDETVIVPVTICSDEDGATFTAYWEGLDDAVDLKLIPPSGPGRMITPSTSNRGIRYGEHPRYNYYQLDFPLGGDLSGEWAGEWKMKMTGTDRIDQPQKVRYSASALAEGGVKFEVNFNNLFYTAGDTVIIIGKLTRSGHPFAGADIDVYCDVPIVGAGNVLYDNKVSIDELKKFKEINKDPISLIDSKLKILNMRAEKDVLLRGETQFKLYDDGRHGDGKENDGIYAFSFIRTTVPGSYTFRFVASNILCGAGITTTREWTKSFYSGVVAQPDYSVIDIRAIEFTPDGYRYDINVVPRDPLKNYLGPGHEVIVNVIQYGSCKGIPQILLKDNIDGTYTNEIFVTQEQLKAGVKLDIELDGNKFTTIDKLPTLGK